MAWTPEILRDLTFSIAPRSFQFLTGPSGAGKTTLLRLILMSVKPSAAWSRFSARRSSRSRTGPLTSLRRRMGVVFQDFRLLDHLTTLRTWPFPCARRGERRRAIAARSIELLRWVGLGERMHVLPPVLSGGEKQRAALARALIVRPDLLLADEPTGNVDPSLARRLLRLFIEFNRLGTSVVIATHDLALMDQLDARRLVLGEGGCTSMSRTMTSASRSAPRAEREPAAERRRRRRARPRSRRTRPWSRCNPRPAGPWSA